MGLYQEQNPINRLLLEKLPILQRFGKKRRIAEFTNLLAIYQEDCKFVKLGYTTKLIVLPRTEAHQQTLARETANFAAIWQKTANRRIYELIGHLPTGL